MVNSAREDELRRALLEIEWASRRRPTAENLRHINAVARAAIRAASTGATSPAYGSARTGATRAPLFSSIAGRLSGLRR
jgi:hypothetical protein